MIIAKHATRSGWLIMAIALLVTTAVYWHGLYGSWLFDDYPNIVDNHDLQITDAHLPSLVRAALSSPSSEFKRPLASLSFAANYLVAGLDPFSWKLTNLAIHLLNGLLVYLLSKGLLLAVGARPVRESSSPHNQIGRPPHAERAGVIAALIAASWMLLPINLTGVLYVVQRMESLANLFVLIGLLGYVAGRERMMTGQRGLWLCISSVLIATAIGLLAKETAVMLPLYAFLVECMAFRFANSLDGGQGKHRGLTWFFALVLAMPLVVGLGWLLPGLLKASTWATRDFTLGTRLLSEARIVGGYLVWILLPTPGSLSFYHDDFIISTGPLTPWTTLASIVFLVALATGAWTQRRRRPLVALGVAFYLGCHLLTGTILPLELIYEHRNYFASFGLLLAVIPLLAAPGARPRYAAPRAERNRSVLLLGSLPMPLARHVLLVGLILCWTLLTVLTAHAWSNPLRLAQDLASRAPDSPRAQYELGRTYIIYSHYDPASPFVHLAYAPLEKAAALPYSSILPEQALIFMNSRMQLPLKDAWWDSMIAKLKRHKPGVQDESSLSALMDCMHQGQCILPPSRMAEAYLAALSHPHPSPRLLSLYADFAWNILSDHALGERMITAAVQAAPDETAYRITLVRMLAAQGKDAQAKTAFKALETLNYGGRLDSSISELHKLPALQ